jgi:hypothetical protein
MTKNAKIFVFSAVALVILIIAAAEIKDYLDHKRLMAEGTRAEASVLELYEHKSRRRRSTSTSYYAKVGLLEKDTAAGAAAPLDIHITRSLYDKFQVGQRIKVIYMPGEPHLAEVLEE